MKVRELIDILSKLPQDLDVVINGYEDGAEDVDEELIRIVKIRRGVYNNWYDGPHKLLEKWEDVQAEDVDVVHIARAS